MISMPAAPRVALRVDASATMGTGHLRRCLSLAQALVELGALVDLLVRRLDEVASQVLSDSIPDTRLNVLWLPAPASPFVPEAEGPPHQAWSGVPWNQDALETVALLRDAPPDWLVVDHYAFEARWHGLVRQNLGCRLLAIDDLADRALDVDVLLDQNLDADHRAKYAACLRRKPRWLTGPRYALLSAAYRDAPGYQFHEPVRSLGIFTGGTDPGGASAQVLKICRHSGFVGAIEIASSSANPHLAELRAACAATPGTSLTLDEPNLAGFFARHDLQVGAGGGATWERCCIGVPTISLVLAANQMVVAPVLDKLGVLRAARLDGHSAPEDMPTLSQVLAVLLADQNARRSLGERAALLVDGRGSQRVALSLLRDALRLRPATSDDGQMLHSWRNHPAVRAVSGAQAHILFADHLVWMHRVLTAGDRWLFVAEMGQLPVGCIRFDRLTADRVEVSLYLDPDLQGLGLGQCLLLAGERTMRGHLGHDFAVIARVLPRNTASQHLFEACGYHGGPLQYLKTVGASPTSIDLDHEDPRL